MFPLMLTTTVQQFKLQLFSRQMQPLYYHSYLNLLITDVAACFNKKGEAEIHFATNEYLNSNYSVCRPVGRDQLSVNNSPVHSGQVDINDCISIGPWSSKELGHREPPVGEELEDSSPLPLQPKPHGAGKITTHNAVAVAANRLEATGKSRSHPKPSYHPTPAGKLLRIQ